ncbi:hypothetical protein [Zavarzinella formosa]|uniref:hypothetical protein n=1 Tax=Zavarzinella formosa TaxID=360055 RepID=UPI0002E0271C|nr:hypothetical protein [Zavarzinella formosa]
MRRSPRLALAALLAAAPLMAQEKLRDANSPETRPMPGVLPSSFTIKQTLPLSRELAVMMAVKPIQVETQISCGVRLVRVSDEMMKSLRFQSGDTPAIPQEIRGVSSNGIVRIGVNFEANPTSPDETRRVQFLKNDDLRPLMEKFQADPATNIMQAPKITMMAGEPASIQVVDHRYFVTDVKLESDGDRKVFVPRVEMFDIGTKMALSAIPSADGRFVKLTADVRVREMADGTVPMKPVTINLPTRLPNGSPAAPVAFTQYIEQPKIITRGVKDTLAIPTDHSAILYAGTASHEVRKEFAPPPTIARIPYINRLFRNVGYGVETDHLLVILTPLVLPAEEPCREKCQATDSPVKLLGNDQLKLLLKAYEEACAEGSTDDARRLAIECLAIDPTCFGKK